ncbi:MAG TPA: hypothetical protein VJ946_01255, partial [Bacteroidales bacterium]|nr:hypothetical protein [Bacteroidales bacterium]
MLNIKTIRTHKDWVIDRLQIKNFDAKPTVETLLETDDARKQLQADNDKLLSEQKKVSKSIG